jgi:hypothetical protein
MRLTAWVWPTICEKYERKKSCVHSALSCKERGNSQDRIRRAGFSRISLKCELNITATRIFPRCERCQLISNIIYLMEKHTDYAVHMNA